MAGDWIKMRVWLSRDPKVIRMADVLASDRVFMEWLTNPVRQRCVNSAYEHVTRNVTVALCVTALLVTWGSAREQGDRVGDDLVLAHCDFETLDAMTDLPGFGAALGSVGWASEQQDGSILFPKFFKDNESPDDRHKRQNAERQARHRQKLAEESNAKSNVADNVTHNVTVTTEKRREEKSKSTVATRPAPRRLKTPLPENFTVSPRVTAWAAGKGYTQLDEHLEAFKRKCEAKGYTNIDWDAAFMEAIREDWAKLRGVVRGVSNENALKVDV